jgi:3-hydroxyacyl-CoA dehydrogenase / enoyl-CoA hydratase / 3-hydroxybutyryl-CoA epimerase
MSDTSSTIRWDKDEDGVVILTLDDPSASANTMNEAYQESIRATVDRLEAERDEITGVIITSAKKTFFAGANLNDLKTVTRDDAGPMEAFVRDAKAVLRRLETLGRPVVAAINGTALGGGLEITLACHHRIIVDDPRIKLGFPEVKLGLLPGAGGVTRSVRMFGIAAALLPLLLQGKEYRPAEAKEFGLVDEIVATPDELIPAAKQWIAANPEAVQPWDVKGYKIPGGTPSNPKFAANLPAFPANLRKQIKGANLPAPHHILAAAVEGSQVDFDNASEIEGRYFVDLVTGQVAKNMIQAFFFDLQRATGKRGRPDDLETFRPEKIVVLGAGMMGAAIAYVAAKAGVSEVVLKDVSQEAADRGKAYSEKLVAKDVERGRRTQEDGDALLARITPTVDAAAADGADLVIEAVFEDPAVKREVMAEIEPHLAPDALLGSNTSTLPITGLAENVTRPAEFVGLHFFSPVDKMPLLEIIRGEQTSDETLYRALDVAKLLRKTPIVVNDSRGFFTSRVISTFLNEGIAMLAEGVPPATIEQASSQAGYPAPVLQLSDELNMKLMQRIRDASKAAAEHAGAGWTPHPAEAVIDTMVDELDRPGRLEGRGFYEYEDGKRTRLWPGLRDAYPWVADPSSIPLQDLIDRMLFIESIESVRCVDEGVIESVADANVGSILGIGFPGWTGGVLQYINGYQDPTDPQAAGPAAFVARARELAAKYGDRFEPPASLVERAERGGVYSDRDGLVPAA